MADANAPPLTLLSRIEEAEATGLAFRTKLTGWGWLRLDRPQPVLCLHRRPAGSTDRATSGLLAPLGSHLVACAGDKSAIALARALIDKRLREFGACLVLEIWASEATDPNADIVLHAPARGVDADTLETLQRVAQATDWGGGEARLDLRYGEIAPPTAETLPFDTGVPGDVLHLGLEIAPTYLDRQTEKAYPIRFRQVRSALSHIVKQAAFAFAHSSATSRPAHYHELGPGEVEDAVWSVDAALADLADDFQLLLHVTPVNVGEAWQAFQTSGHAQAPEFHYRPLTVDPSEMKRTLFSIPLETVDDPAFHQVFEDKRDELDRQISLVRDRETPPFLHSSLQIYGAVEDTLIGTAKRILSQSSQRPSQPHHLDATTFAEAAAKEVGLLKRQDPSFRQGVSVREDTSGLLVSNGNLFIGQDAIVGAHRLDAAIQHEVGTHMLTYHNGAQQPLQLLRTGLAGYDALQEGLAVLAEYLVGGLETNRLRQLAARVLAAKSVQDGADFIETFELMREMADMPARSAFLTTMRVHRGGGFTKDAVYLRGLQELLTRLAEGLDHERLLIGKLGFDQLSLVDEMVWRGILKAPALRPSYLDREESAVRLSKLKARPCIETLLETAQ